MNQYLINGMVDELEKIGFLGIAKKKAAGLASKILTSPSKKIIDKTKQFADAKKAFKRTIGVNPSRPRVLGVPIDRTSTGIENFGELRELWAGRKGL